MKFHCTLFVIALSLAAPSALAQDDGSGHWLPERATIEQIEAKLTLPAGASPLNTYVRYYSGVTEQGRKIIRGVYLVVAVVRNAQQDSRPGIRIVVPRDIPEIDDGGCHQVNVEYDVASAAVTGIHCNGVA
jgi:hypothetical protein